MSSSIAGAADARPELIASTIPLLDVAPYLAGAAGAREQLGAELRWAFEKVGFYYLRGHGIPQSLIDATVRPSGPIPCAAHGASTWHSSPRRPTRRSRRARGRRCAGEP